ncbi:MAG TPA: aminotransferase class V-fold PLP-dependent enzyme [Solirubrobacteraceae bacterium]|nr:aminotransferase class V-fold PLP-dependent enzyme [Solirubrobacteraceae bacterium]
MAATADPAPLDLAVVARDRFPDVRGHLDSATTGVPPLAAVRAARAAIADWEQGRVDARRLDEDVERSRAAFARILGVPTDEIACGSQVSVFAGLVAASLPTGAEILVAAGDFTSVLFPMLAQQARGVRVRETTLERLPEGIDGRTTLVAVSAVQSADGRVADLERLSAAAEHHGVDVFLDVTQAAGWLPIDGRRFTYVCGGAYKWLLSPRGTALMRVAPEAGERLIPHTAGWYSAADPWSACYGGPLRLPGTAKRFDVSPAWTCWAGTAPALELIDELGAERIGAYDRALAERLREGLGLPRSESAIVSVAASADAPERPDAEARLRAAGVRAAVRAGRVRLACHLPATVEDVDRAVAALS